MIEAKATIKFKSNVKLISWSTIAEKENLDSAIE